MTRQAWSVGTMLLGVAALLCLRGQQATTRNKDANTAAQQQRVEGFAEIVFAQPHERNRSSVDYRGNSPGYMTAEWWSPGQMKNNSVVWRTAICPTKAPTVFSFVAASAVTPPDIARGPVAKLYVNDHYALTFELGVPRSQTWREGHYELRYVSKLVEWPYATGWRQYDLAGASGVYSLSVPASQVAAGKAVELKVEMVPFPRWPNSWFMIKEYRDTLQNNGENLAQQVEQLQQEVNRLGEANHVLATRVYSELVDSPDREFHHFLVYTNGYRHTHPPNLIPLKNGDILLTFREATEHIAPDGDVIMLRSRDGGKTWGERQVVGKFPDLDQRSGCGVQLRDGTIVMNIFVNAMYRPDGTYYHARDASSVGRRGLRTASYTIISSDNGRTWSEPHFVDAPGMPSTYIEGPTHPIIEMPNGSIIMPMEAYVIKGDPRNWGSFVLKSEDKGKTWQYLATIADDPGGRLGSFEEPGLVRTKTGRIIAVMRNSGPAKAIWTSHSDDGGKTWSTAKPTPMKGHPADLIQLHDGRILCSYGYRAPSLEPEHGEPAGIRACFSRDNGETWQIDDEVVIRRDFFNHDIGYPHSLQLKDGRILTVYYANLFARYFIGGTFWKP